MYYWDDGRQPIKKMPRWAMVGLLLIYIIALTSMIMPFFISWDKKVSDAYRLPYRDSGTYYRWEGN